MKVLPKVFNQQDPAWGDITLGTASGVTIQNDGCYVTSDTDGAVYFGKDTDPARLNQAYTQAGVFVNQDLLPDDALARVYPDITLQEVDNYQTIPADLNKLKDLVADPTLFIIVEIDLGSGNTHFTPVVDCDGTTVTIANPWDGTIENFTKDYGDPAKNILKFVVYKGTPANQAQSDQVAVNVEKSVQFDEMLTELKNDGLVPSDDSNQYVSSDPTKNNGLLNVLKNLLVDYKSQRQRAGWYDQVCISFGYKGDTNTFTSDQLVKLINSQTDNATIANLNTKLAQEQQATKDALLEVDSLKKQLTTAGNVSTEPASGQSYQDLYVQIKKDYDADSIAWSAQFKTDVSVFSQLKRTNIYYLPTSTIFTTLISRLSRQSIQLTFDKNPPLDAEDFKYAETVPPPQTTSQGKTQPTNT